MADDRLPYSGVLEATVAVGDWQWMSRALELAERGRGAVEPNPLVGAVVVRDNRIVGEGWHERYGQAHAEVNALVAAGAAAREATLYVTLEPCCHYAKTPPCAQAVVRAGIRRVVTAMGDPFAQVAGKGLAFLRENGVAVECGLAEAEARRLNAPYLKLLATGRPYVHVKWAMTLDGKIGTRTGDSKWISNRSARQRVHALRGRVDAIVIGIGTALADDPLLTARPPGPRTPARIVLDSRGRLPATSQLARTAGKAPLILGTAEGLPERCAAEFRALGVDVLSLPTEEGRPSVSALLDELGRRRMTNILVEGGSGVLGSFLDAGQIDEVHVAVAPLLVGGAEAAGPFGGRGVADLQGGLRLAEWQVEIIEDNVWLHGRTRGWESESATGK
jgi:diaminohydroxyphosphoribosylaminopyrimidine deaminase/5-amino-6-(5-phosphoribosylamino)uracil reductase